MVHIHDNLYTVRIEGPFILATMMLVMCQNCFQIVINCWNEKCKGVMTFLNRYV